MSTLDDLGLVSADGPQMEKPHFQVRLTPRADRFYMALPLRYRSVAEQTWHEGEIENISGSGILFRAGKLLDVSTKIELTFSLPAPDPEQPAARVVCGARVVRIAPIAGPGTRPALAAAITRLRFSTEGRA